MTKYYNGLTHQITQISTHPSEKHRSQVSQEIINFKNLAIHLKRTLKSSNSNEKMLEMAAQLIQVAVLSE